MSSTPRTLTANTLAAAINADLEAVAPEPTPKRTPAYVIAAFAPLPTLSAGQHLTREHAVCLDAYRHACGLPPWLEQAAGADVTAAVNQAVAWWNSWHGKKGRGNA